MAPPQSKELKDLLKDAQEKGRKETPPSVHASHRAKSISSISGFINQKTINDKLYSKEFVNIQKSIKTLLDKSKQERVRGVGQAETIKEVESSAAKMMDKMGTLFQSVNSQLTKSTSAFYNLSKETLGEYKDAIRSDISINKTNTVAMALAQSTPIFGYFVGKFMETGMFKKMTETIKAKFSSAIGWVAERFKGVFASLSTKTRSWFQRRAEAKVNAAEAKKGGKLPAKPIFPKMQTGGYVTKGGMVQVHKAEIVTPVEKFFKFMEAKTGKKDLLDKIEYWIKEISFGVIDLEKFIKRERIEQRGFIESFIKNWQEERHFEEKDWRERVVRTLAELKTGLFGMTSTIRIAWQRTLMEHPTFRYMIAAAEVFKVTFVKPIKWLFGIRGGYRGMLPKGSNTLQNIQDINALMFTNMMPKLDQISLTLKELFEAMTKGKATEAKEDTYTMMEKIKNFFVGKTTFRSPFESIVERLELSKDTLKEAGVTRIRDLFKPSVLLKAVGITEDNIMKLYERMGVAKKKAEEQKKEDFIGPKQPGYFRRLIDSIKASMSGASARTGAGGTAGMAGMVGAAGGGLFSRKPFAWVKEKKTEYAIQSKELWKNVYGKIYGKLSDVAENTKKPAWYRKIMGWLAQAGLFILSKLKGLLGLFAGGGKGLWNLLKGALGLGVIGGKGLYGLVSKTLGRIFGTDKIPGEFGGYDFGTGTGKYKGRSGGRGKGGLLKRGVGVLGRGARGIGKGVGRVAGRMGPMGIGGLAIGGIMAMADAKEAAKRAKEWGVPTWSAMLGGALGGVGGGWEGLKEGALKGAGLGAAAGSIIPGVGTAIGAGVGAIAGSILGYIGGENMAKGINAVWGGMKDLAEVMWKWIKYPIELGIGAAQKLGSYIGDKLYDTVESVKSGIDKTRVVVGNALHTVVDGISRAFTSSFEFIMNIGEKIKDWIVDKVMAIPGIGHIISGAKAAHEVVGRGVKAGVEGVKYGAGVAKAGVEKVIEMEEYAKQVVRAEVSSTAANMARKVKNLFWTTAPAEPGRPPVDVEGLKPSTKKSFTEMAKEYVEKTGNMIQVNSAYRSVADQAKLYAALPKGQAAPPGRSMHEKGVAIDINSVDANKLASMGLLEKYGFTRPVSKEAWHLQHSGEIGDAKPKDFYAKPFFTGRGLADMSTNEALMNAAANSNMLKQIGDGFGELAKSSQSMQSAIVSTNNIVNNSIRATSSNSGRQSSGMFDSEIQGLLSGNLP